MYAITTVAAVAGLALGLLTGLWAKPARQQFSTCCGTTLGCVTCAHREGNGASPRPDRQA